MLDLNVDSLCVDSSCDGTRRSINIINLLVESKCQADDSEASNSSVVNADEYPSNVGDEDSSSTRIMPSDGFFTVNFSILNSNKGQANCIENGLEIEDESIGITSSELVTMQLFPVSSEGGGEEFCSGFSSVTSVLRPQWLNLSVPESSRVPEFRAITPQKQQPLVKRSRRGPKSRSSQYRGVTFYRRTGRWESHIWDCGKQVYLGGFDTAHAAARAYDRAAIKFRGVDADINFVISDYEDDMEQTKNMTKEEFVHVLRRQSNGIPRGSSKYRGAILQKCAPWEARMGQFLDKKVNEKAVIKCNIREAATNFESTKIVQATNDGGGGHDLDLKLQISPPSLNAPKRNENENIRSPHFQFPASEMPAGKRQKLEVKTSGCAALTGGQASSGLTMASKQPLIGPGIYSHFKPYHEEIGKGIGKGGEAIGLTPKWPWQMNNHTLLSSTTTTTAASSGFSSTATSLSASLPPLSPLHQRPTTASFRRPPTGTTTTTTLSPLC